MTLSLAACTPGTDKLPSTQAALDIPTQSVVSMPVCGPADLLTSASSNGATGAIMLGLTLTNKSGNLCTLANPPQVKLLDANDQPIEAQTSPSLAVMTPPAPELLALAPRDNVIVSMVWRNYCQLMPGDMLTIRLTLAPNENVDIAMKLPAEPRCDNMTEPSTVTIAPYSYPP